jgi:hypothetical protein
MVVALAWLPASLCAQVRCLSNPDTAATFIADVERGLSNTDSTGLSKVGLPYRPRSVTLVTHEPLCASAFDAYNALGPSRPVEQAYLIRVDSAAFVMVPMEPEYRSHNTMVYMTNGFKVIFNVVDLD